MSLATFYIQLHSIRIKWIDNCKSWLYLFFKVYINTRVFFSALEALRRKRRREEDIPSKSKYIFFLFKKKRTQPTPLFIFFFLYIKDAGSSHHLVKLKRLDNAQPNSQPTSSKSHSKSGQVQKKKILVFT